MDAYDELELVAEAEFAKHRVKFFSELPDAVQREMLDTQETVLKKHGITRDEYLSRKHNDESPTICLTMRLLATAPPRQFITPSSHC